MPDVINFTFVSEGMKVDTRTISTRSIQRYIAITINTACHINATVIVQNIIATGV